MFCHLFAKQDIDTLLFDYGKMYQVDYTKSLINLFDIVLNNVVFSVLSGNEVSELSITEKQNTLICHRFQTLNMDKIYELVDSAFNKIIKDLKINNPKLINYINQYQEKMAFGILSSVKNNSLKNMIITSFQPPEDRVIYETEEKMDDEAFKGLVEKIIESYHIHDKIRIIQTNIKSFKDFLDLLNADCLFENEFIDVFQTLDDMELAVIGRIVFVEKTRNGPLSLISTPISELRYEWVPYYLKYLESLDKNRQKSIEGIINRLHDS